MAHLGVGDDHEARSKADASVEARFRRTMTRPCVAAR